MSQNTPLEASGGRVADDGRHKRRWALGAGGGAHALHDGYTDTLYVLFPIWAESFGLSYLQVGVLKMLFSGSMAGFQIPAGLLAERLGERRLLAAGTVLLGAGFAGFALAGGVPELLLCLVIAGLGAGVQHPLASSVIARAFGDGMRRAALGAYNFLGDIGKVLAPAAMAFAVAALGWRPGALAFGALAAVAGVAVFLVLRRIDLGSRPAALRDADPDAPKGWGVLNPRAFACLAGIGMIDTGARGAFLMLLPFLLADKGAEVQTVGIALALTFAGGAAGKLVCGLAAERIGIIRLVVITEFLTAGAIIAAVALPLAALMAMLPLLGMALNGTSSVLYGTVGDFAHPDRRSRVFGLFYTLGIAASASAPVLFGLIGDAAGLQRAIVATGVLALFALPLCLMLRPAIANRR